MCASSLMRAAAPAGRTTTGPANSVSNVPGYDRLAVLPARLVVGMAHAGFHCLLPRSLRRAIARRRCRRPSSPVCSREPQPPNSRGNRARCRARQPVLELRLEPWYHPPTVDHGEHGRSSPPSKPLSNAEGERIAKFLARAGVVLAPRRRAADRRRPREAERQGAGHTCGEGDRQGQGDRRWPPDRRGGADAAVALSQAVRAGDHAPRSGGAAHRVRAPAARICRA